MVTITGVDKSSETIGELLTEPLRIGEPASSGPITVFPIFSGEPAFAYTSLADGLSHGLKVGEVAAGASVNDLTVVNPTPMPVMLYEGEEVLGAQQNRTTDATVIVAAGSETTIPVSCVEHGRWDGSRHGDAFQPAPQTAYPELRRQKSRQLRERVNSGAEARANQGEVWRSVAERSQEMKVSSPTGAMHDVFESRRGEIAKLAGALSDCVEGQTGSLFAIGQQLVVLDWVSRPGVYKHLHPALVQGYALDALANRDALAGRPNRGDAEGFISLVCDNRSGRRPTPGVGHALGYDGNGAEGTGLAIERELVQLTAFPAQADGTQPTSRRTRISRPSHRRG